MSKCLPSYKNCSFASRMTCWWPSLNEWRLGMLRSIDHQSLLADIQWTVISGWSQKGWSQRPIRWHKARQFHLLISSLLFSLSCCFRFKTRLFCCVVGLWHFTRLRPEAFESCLNYGLGLFTTHVAVRQKQAGLYGEGLITVLLM